MKKALLVGIDDYPFAPLQGAVADAQRMLNILSKNSDLSPNFDCRLLISAKKNISEALLLQSIQSLLDCERDNQVLFYFSGHGHLDALGGYLVAQDSKAFNPGVRLHDIVQLANRSQAKEVVIILDCCHAGQMAQAEQHQFSLRKGISLLLSSTAQQASVEENQKGLFTSLLYEGLEGGASDLLGKVTAVGLFNYVDQLLGSWDQRPIFKTYSAKMMSLRSCPPRIPIRVIRRLPTYFTTVEALYLLSPDHEPTAEPRDPKKEAIFADLLELRSVDLIEPINEKHMYFAAINNEACRLTPRGKFYWQLVQKKKI